jgi:hypothetical protein
VIGIGIIPRWRNWIFPDIIDMSGSKSEVKKLVGWNLDNALLAFPINGFTFKLDAGW